MAVFDTVIVPTGLTPANTSEATLYTGITDSAVLVRASNVDGTASVNVRVGQQASGGSTFWHVFDLPLPAGDAVTVGPVFLRVNDLIRVQSGTASDATFTVSGVRST